MEDLKERYYSICGKLAKVRAGTGTEPKIYIFDAGHERRRKEQLERLFNRTPEQVRLRIFFYHLHNNYYNSDILVSVLKRTYYNYLL